MDRRWKNLVVEKENDHRNGNRKNYEADRPQRKLKTKLPLIQDKDLKIIRISKEVRNTSRPLVEHPLKPIDKCLKPETLTNTQQYCKDYAEEILIESAKQSKPMGLFLVNHEIDKGLRARMLDWMIEVTSSYKFKPKTYFTAVHIMDSYFRAEQQRLPITKLHIVGVISMLIASKMDQVYPLKIKTVYEKIVHKKIDKRQLVETEARIAEQLSFMLNAWTFYDLALLKLYQEISGSQEDLKDIEQIIHLAAKFIVFNYELYNHYSTKVLADALLILAFRIDGRQRWGCSKFSSRQAVHEEMVCAELMLDAIQGFKSNYRLNNIFKFSNQTAMDRILDRCKK